MKRILALALAGLGLTAASTTALAQDLNIQGDLPAVQERERAQALYQAECVIGRHQFIGEYIAAQNRAAALATLAIQATGQLIDANAAEHAEFDAAARAAQTQVQIPGQTLGENE